LVILWRAIERRDEKMGRLIDADVLIKYIKIWEIGTSISSDQKEFIDCVNKQPTAFDIDKISKEIPKKPIIYPGTNRADCPVCMKTVRGIGKPFGKYCAGCGQRLKWEAED
jgi:hypothetical protein